MTLGKCKFQFLAENLVFNLSLWRNRVNARAAGLARRPGLCGSVSNDKEVKPGIYFPKQVCFSLESEFYRAVAFPRKNPYIGLTPKHGKRGCWCDILG